MRSTLAGLLLTVSALGSDASQSAPQPAVQVAAAGGAAHPQPTIASPKRYEVPSYSFATPIKTNTHLSNWVLGGSAQFVPAGLSVLDEQTAHEGSAWHHVPIHGDTYDLDMELDIRGPPDPRTADGFALWLVSERDYGVFLKPGHGDVWSMFGYKPWFNGLGVFFSTNDRTNNARGSISAAFNNGTRSMDVTKEVPSSDGIYFNYRNGHGPLRFRLNVSKETIKGSVRWNTEKEWRHAFSLKVNPGMMPATPFIGITASNRRIAKGESTLAMGTSFGDRLIVNRFELSTEEPFWPGATVNPAQSILEHVVYDDSLEPNVQLRVLSETLLKHLMPRQEHLLAEISRLQQHNRMLTDRVDILHTYLTRGANDEKMQQALEGLKSVVFKSSRDNAEKLDELHGKLEGQSVEELKLKSAELHSSVIQSERRALVLMLSLGGVFLGVGFCLFKRMRDMEKKHIL